MKEKKQSANWYVAATHYLTSGFAIPGVVMILGSMLLGFILDLDKNMFAFKIALNLLGLLAIWLGVQYSAWWINKTHIIENVSKVITFSTVYFVVIKIGWTILFIPKVIDNRYLIEILFVVINCIAFYLASKEYLPSKKE